MRINITLPDDAWKAFTKQAEAEKKSLSQWLFECGTANLPGAVEKQLTATRRGRGRPPKTDKK